MGLSGNGLGFVMVCWVWNCLKMMMFDVEPRIGFEDDDDVVESI